MTDSKKIQLSPVWQKRYRITKIFVYVSFFLCLLFAIYLILFPSANFVFSFKNPDSSKNTVVEPRSEKGELIKNGKVKNGEKLIFDTNPIGDFSEAEINITLKNKLSDSEEGEVSVRRSFRSFFYPEGEESVAPENTDFPKLLSANNSVFITSGEKIWPIADVITFESMGWNWDNVQKSNSEEIGNYEKQKLFTLKTPHPDGTVFSEKESGEYYLIEDRTKKKISNVEAVLPKLKIDPIIADKKGLDIKENCTAKKSFSLLKKYTCTIPIEKMQNIAGNDYQFEAKFEPDVEIKDLSITFRKTLNSKNLMSSLALLKSRIFANYYGN